jgi:ubiquinone/menaquinone biosynthesis C-methylase UbiE
VDSWSSGTSYEAYMGRWSRLVAREFVAGLGAPPGLRWLDVGCGTGALTGAALATEPSAVTGVDPSAGFVRHAAAQLADPRASFAVADARALPVATGSVDAVVSGLALNFVPDRHAALAEMGRAARAGGLVAAYVWDYPDGMQLMAHFWDAAVELDPDARPLREAVRFGFCRPEALRSMFARAGLADVDVDAVVVPTVFRDFEDFWKPFLGGQGSAPAYAAGLDDAALVALRDAVRERLPREDDGSVRLTARAWTVRGSCS